MADAQAAGRETPGERLARLEAGELRSKRRAHGKNSPEYLAAGAAALA